MAAGTGRVVLNHSTHIEGLIPVLEKLAKVAGISTLTPGVIAPVKGKSPHLHLRVSVPIKGGFKLIARRGKTVQEVFVITQLSEAELKAAIDAVLASK
ncbi:MULTISPECIES: DUF2103 domain-containing protein [unclassified Thermosynechococcus]|uniref:DUF2103 domain-containing protein n=1 Tax=unclassified Thermosynechococcus TaxID=2622553 RepID=UPI002673BC59|nr:MULTISPECIES: DUF2103 domain-containing protein [unclassified Thermosynechococcus]MDR7922412.1 DUF2103 domain-containing protein [Thermosynechococcus sp. HY213]WKT81018.1 DUF2103 domain-containing protein [Thermosynechococcus sp. PP45]WNC22076.1 DUF2103 domain-containing protein [Thermosynechococcus sp. PP22]WNC24629.1 DUF2103 domain-containing protein [Thermosynechococcus sp. PP551]WNC27207.1 DUF2103 domain-containing protein [Thermosynechococcus sp. PP555]